MNAPLIHSPTGGSGAARTLACPGSIPLIEQTPIELRRKSSVYADDGTAKHTATAAIIADDLDPLSVVGRDFNGVVITREHVLDFIQPALSYVDPLLAEADAFLLDQRVRFPGVEGSFGTLDFLSRIGSKVNLVDFKFGTGITVRAVYPDAERGDLLNSQLMFYLAGARFSLPAFFEGVDRYEIAIVQPQTADGAEMVSTTEVSAEEIDDFEVAFQEACREAIGPSPRIQRGDHCRFCPAKVICPAHTGPLLNLAHFDLSVPATAKDRGEAFGQVLAAGLDLVEATKDLRTALHDEAKRLLKAGTPVPGYALSRGRTNRSWHDEAEATQALLDRRGDALAEAGRDPGQGPRPESPPGIYCFEPVRRLARPG